MDKLIFFFGFIITIITAIVFHEFGHWLYIERKKNISMELHFFYKNIKSFGIFFLYPKNLSLDEKINLYLMGIFFGLFPCFLFFLVPYNLTGLIFVVYFVGCDHDIQLLIKAIEEKNKGKGD